MKTIATLAHLTAAAEDLLDHGMMNLQKLLEALVYAAVRVEARSYHREGDPAERIREIDRLIGDLPENVIPPGFRKLMEKAMQHYSAEAKGDLNYTLAPDVFVCRKCGYITVASAPEICSECKEAAGMFRRFQGMFNGDNTEPEDPSALIDLLDENARQLERLVSGRVWCTTV